MNPSNPDIQSLLLQASRSVLECHDFQSTARSLFDACCQATGARSGYVALLNEEGNENEVLFLEAGGLPCDVNPELPMPIRGLRAEAYTKQATVVDNAFADSKWMEFMPPGHVELRNVLFAPLTINGTTVGIMGLANKDGHFTPQDMEVATSFGELAAIALRNTRTKDQLRQSLQDKETILRELYHRTKNDLTVVSSLLRLQGSRITDPQAQAILQDLQDKIHSMSLVHQKLYRSASLSNIDLSSYIRDLAGEMLQSRQRTQGHIDLQFDLEPLVLPINTAVPIGLVLTELISNAMKHAFPDGRDGTITIILQKGRESRAVLEIRDNGVGMPAEAQPADSLGLEISRAIVESQLRGSISLIPDNGVCWHLEFPIAIQ